MVALEPGCRWNRCRAARRLNKPTAIATTPTSNCMRPSPTTPRVLIAAIEQAGSANPADYLPKLRAIHYQGVTGAIAFDAQGNLQQPSFTLYR